VSSDTIIAFDKVCRQYHTGGQTIGVLESLSLTVQRGQRVAIMGASGSGKTTLLHLAAGMDQADGGTIELCGHRLDDLGEPALTRLRARHVGLVFQDFNLLDSLTVVENIELPLWLNGLTGSADWQRQLVDTLGLENLLQRLPDTLSGGEKQRVAIARALIHRPDLVLADEPTGSLDQTTASGVLQLFDQITDQTGTTLLMVTHNQEAASVCEQVLSMRHGQLIPA
jgi:ABC-type lipoprotein export system ATPase subunit